MQKTWSVSSAEDDIYLVNPDQLRGSQSERYLRNCRSNYGPPQDEVQDGLFVDPKFPRAELDLDREITWKRPGELVKSPAFIVGGATHLDIVQGEINDCWFLSAIASLSLNQCLLKKVVPVEQSFQDGYDGKFIFKFWSYGTWKEVVVDDRLPFKNKKLLYLSSATRNEFWSSLLEKAYAKFKGGYTSLNMGMPHEAMVDLTGGVTDVIDVRSFKGNLAEHLKRQLTRRALINTANLKGESGEENAIGIIFGHAYALTGVEQVITRNGPVTLLQVLNPWGHTEWKGPWSDEGTEWSMVSQKEQQRIGRIDKNEGKFWMAVSDFERTFDLIEVCYMTDEIMEGCSWTTTMCNGNWAPGSTAGGCKVNLWRNPQFHFALKQTDSGSTPSNLCSFIFALMQKHERRKDIQLKIGLHVYKAHPTKTFLKAEDLEQQVPVLKAPHQNRREIVLRGSLPPGNYIIIPSTIDANQRGAFLLRCLTEKGNAANEALKQLPRKVPTETVVYNHPHKTALPPFKLMEDLYKKHCSKKNGLFKAHHLYRLLNEAFQYGDLKGSEKMLSLEQCKTFVALRDSQADAQLSWHEFNCLWEKICQWTDIFISLDTNQNMVLDYQEIRPALIAAGVNANPFIMQLVVFRYTEPDGTISYPGFLYLMLKLEATIHTFQSHDVTGRGTITLDYKQWLYRTLYS